MMKYFAYASVALALIIGAAIVNKRAEVPPTPPQAIESFDDRFVGHPPAAVVAPVIPAAPVAQPAPKPRIKSSTKRKTPGRKPVAPAAEPQCHELDPLCQLFDSLRFKQ